MPYSIELRNVSFAYDDSEEIFSRVGVCALPGEVVAIAGEVGSGKSTLLKLCAGILEPSSGDLLINGRAFFELSRLEQDDMRSKMGFDFQESALIANMSVFNNLAIALRYHSNSRSAEIDNRVTDCLHALGLKGAKNLLPAALSAGVRRKVSFARAMLMGREFFFWDEPFQIQDPSHLKNLEDMILRKKAEGIGSIFTTSDYNLARRFADKIVEI